VPLGKRRCVHAVLLVSQLVNAWVRPECCMYHNHRGGVEARSCAFEGEATARSPSAIGQPSGS